MIIVFVNTKEINYRVILVNVSGKTPVEMIHILPLLIESMSASKLEAQNHIKCC